MLVVRADGHMEENAARTEANAARSERRRRLAQAYQDKEDEDNLAEGASIVRYCEWCNHLLNDGSGMLHSETLCTERMRKDKMRHDSGLAADAREKRARQEP